MRLRVFESRRYYYYCRNEICKLRRQPHKYASHMNGRDNGPSRRTNRAESQHTFSALMTNFSYFSYLFSHVRNGCTRASSWGRVWAGWRCELGVCVCCDDNDVASNKVNSKLILIRRGIHFIWYFVHLAALRRSFGSVFHREWQNYWRLFTSVARTIQLDRLRHIARNRAVPKTLALTLIDMRTWYEG